MRLSMIDRLALLQILPREGGLLDVRAVHELRQALAPSDDEAAELDQAVTPEGLLNEKAAIATAVKEIEVGARATTVVESTLRKLADTNRLPEACLNVWDLFVKEKKT